MRAGMVELSRAGALTWRQNVGLLFTKDGRPVRFGLPGMADTGAIYRGVPLQIEWKDDTGRQSPAQVNWQGAVERAGGVYLLARSTDDIRDLLRRLDNGAPR